MWRVRIGVQISRSEFHTHMYLVQGRVKFLSCIKNKKEEHWKAPIKLQNYCFSKKVTKLLIMFVYLRIHTKMWYSSPLLEELWIKPPPPPSHRFQLAQLVNLNFTSKINQCHCLMIKSNYYELYTIDLKFDYIYQPHHTRFARAMRPFF